MDVAWINTVAEAEADDELRELHEAIRDPATGQLDHILRVHSLHPGGLRAHFDLYTTVMRGTEGVPRVDREMIAMVVSRLNECHYWIKHHRRGLRRLLRDDELVARIDQDFETAGLDARRLAMLRYASRLTLRPARMTRADVDLLRAAGLADADILAVAEVTSYYAYVNRIANGLGVTLEDG